MLANRVKSMLAAGEVPVGHMVWEFKTRGIAALVGGAGCDFILFDMEHSGFDLDAIADLTAWTRGTELTPLVRVPQLEYHFVARCLDAGALGIMFPNVRTAEEASQAVAMVKYPPVGERGLGLGHAHTGYNPPKDSVAYLEEANAQTLVICQIESRSGVDQAEAIAATEGVDVLWVGHNDLSAGLGITGQFESPVFVEAIDAVVAACRKHGKGAGFQPGSIAQARWAVERGFNCLSYGADSALYRRALGDGVAEIRRIAQAEAGRS